MIHCANCGHPRKCVVIGHETHHTGHGIEGKSICHVEVNGRFCPCLKFVYRPTRVYRPISRYQVHTLGTYYGGNEFIRQKDRIDNLEAQVEELSHSQYHHRYGGA